MLIGLTGKKRAGKDSVASVLVDQHDFHRIAFADPLKEAALSLDPLVRIEHDERGPLSAATGFYFAPLQTYRLGFVVEMAGWEAAKEVREVRRTLQRYGVAIREVQPSFWVDAALAKAKPILARGDSVVITDVRFPNELDAIAALCGVHWHVERPGLVNDDPHPSETALEPYYAQADTWVENGSTLDDLAMVVTSQIASARKRGLDS
jgi:hypothetical protein